MKLLATDEYCGILNPERTGAGESPFAVCIQKDVELAKKLYMSCVLDVCMFLNVPYKQEALCLAVDAMAQNCRKNNYDYKEWRKSHSCGMYYVRHACLFFREWTVLPLDIFHKYHYC